MSGELDLRYYKGVRPCIIMYKGKNYRGLDGKFHLGKVLIRFVDVIPHEECITLVRLCWRHKK